MKKKTPEEHSLRSSVGVLVFLVFSFSQVLHFTPPKTIGRYARLVDIDEARATFRAQYRILDNVEIRHCEEGELLVLNRPPEFVVIPMNAFIEGRMELPMGSVTRDYLIKFRLTHTQCSPNVFRILGCVDAINRRLGTNLTWHDVNWVYNYQKGEKTSST